MPTRTIDSGTQLTAFRTAGGVYLWAPDDPAFAGKVSRLRYMGRPGDPNGGTPPRLLSSPSVSFGSPGSTDYSPVTDPAEIPLGTHLLVRETEGDFRWLRSSVILETYSGQVVSEISPGSPHLVMADYGSWWIPSSGDAENSVRFMDDGGNGAPQHLPDVLAESTIIRVESSVSPDENTAAFNHATPPELSQLIDAAVAKIQKRYPQVTVRCLAQLETEFVLMLSGAPTDRDGRHYVAAQIDRVRRVLAQTSSQEEAR